MPSLSTTFAMVIIPLPYRNLLISWSIVICVAMLIAAVVINRKQGGEWRALPTHYTPLAQYLYFGGLAVYVAAVAVARIFS
jgi:hypothetical protein